MRHRRNTTKLKRTASHRKSLLANLACSLIEHGRIRTTFGKAKALRPVAEKLVTQAKRNDLHSRRLAIAFLRQKEAVSKLFAEVAPAAADRLGGYCRITKLGQRMTDAAPMAIIEWVDLPALGADEAIEQPVTEEGMPAKKVSKKKADTKTDIVTAEDVKAEEVKAEEVKAEEVKAEEVKAEEAVTEDDKKKESTVTE